MNNRTRYQNGITHLIVPILVFVLIAVAGYFMFRSKKTSEYSQGSTENSQMVSVSPYETPPLSPTPGLTTNEWNEYYSSEFVYTNNVYSSYSLKYPRTCTRASSVLTCSFKNGTGIIEINAGGHGMEPAETKIIKANEDKAVSAGEGKITLIELVKDKEVFGTYWINKTSKLTQEPIFGFEFRDISISDLQEFETLLDQILNTLVFKESSTNSTYSCPESGWVDCMPGPDKDMGMCTEEAQNWYEANCPNYEGVAY